ncbi:hypothetical protein R1flu_015418 [Riccia fluitans]|uniref:Uncharacterized protein n=1 Tax=Riccia fluitans TaxID=41844 RepID=A0ABD1YM11_9MARC
MWQKNRSRVVVTGHATDRPINATTHKERSRVVVTGHATDRPINATTHKERSRLSKAELSMAVMKAEANCKSSTAKEENQRC